MACSIPESGRVGMVGECVHCREGCWDSGSVVGGESCG